MDMQGIYDLVGDKLGLLFDAQVTGIVTFNLEEKRNINIYEDGERLFQGIDPMTSLLKPIKIENPTH
jgi:hypothetical protein